MGGQETQGTVPSAQSRWWQRRPPRGPDGGMGAVQGTPEGTLGAGLVGAAVRFGRHTSGQGAFLAECCIPNLQTPAHVVQR